MVPWIGPWGLSGPWGMTPWPPGTGCGLLGRRGLTGVHYYYLAALGRSGIFCSEAAEALKARNIPAQGKHAESVRRPGYNGDYIRVPRPLWPQSAKLTGTKGAMELTCLPGVDVGGMPGIQYQSLTDCNWMRSVSHGSWRPTDRRRGETGRVKPMWRPPGAIRSCCHTPGCGALRAPHQGLCMVRPSGPNLAGQTGGFVRFGPKTAIIQWLCFCAVGA